MTTKIAFNQIEGMAVSVRDFGAVGDGVTDDTVAVQAALDYAIPLALNIEVSGSCLVSNLTINKVVDGNTASATVPANAVVDVKGNDTYTRIFSEVGGGFVTSSTGNIFDTDLTNNSGDSPVVQMIMWDNITFESTDPLIDNYVMSPKYLRCVFNACNFRKIRCLASSSVLSQSIYFTGMCNARRWQGIFWDNDYYNYDIKVDILAEAGQDCFKMKNPRGCTFSKGGTIEGMSGTAISYDGAQGLSIQCYFEENGLDVDGTYGNTSSSVSYGVHIAGTYTSKTPETPVGATRANPVVITTSEAHGRQTGDAVYIVSVGGMTEINGLSHRVTRISDTQFSLDGVDGTSYGTFVADGLGRVHPYTIKWGKTFGCASIGNWHTGAMHDITDPVDGLIVHEAFQEKLSNKDSIGEISSGFSGTYTGTLTGCTTSPTGTLRYEKVGNIVTLYIPQILGTSNATNAEITGMPTAILPTRQQIVFARVRDNGTDQLGLHVVTAGGDLSMGVGAPGNSFTATGSKGAQAHTITYSLA